MSGLTLCSSPTYLAFLAGREMGGLKHVLERRQADDRVLFHENLHLCNMAISYIS